VRKSIFGRNAESGGLGSPVVPVNNDVATTFSDPGNDFLRKEGKYQGMDGCF
jgi:hypothetical protein